MPDTSRGTFSPGLILLGFLAGCGAAPSSDRAATTARNAAEMRDHALTMDGIRRYAEAHQAFHARVAADTALQERFAATSLDPDRQGIDAVAHRIESIPQWREEVERAGLTVRDYVLTQYGLVAVAVYSVASDLGLEPPAAAFISGANLDFFEQHQAEIEELLKSVRGIPRPLAQALDAGPAARARRTGAP